MAESSNVQPDDLLVSGLVDNNPLYHKVDEFLCLRGCGYLLPQFKLNKIDDSIAHKCSDEILLQMGLLYGDLLSFHETFPKDQISTTTTTTTANYRYPTEEASAESELTDEEALVNNGHPSAGTSTDETDLREAADEFGQAEVENL
eukprot:gene2482-2857_t